MAIIRTQPLPIQEVQVDPDSLILTIKLPLFSPFIGNIFVALVTSGPNVSGKLFPGTSTLPGRATINMLQAPFDALAQQQLPYKVVLTYDSVTRVISNLNVVVDAALAS